MVMFRGMLRQVIWQKFTGISDERPACLFGLPFDPEGRGTSFLRNIGILLQNYTE